MYQTILTTLGLAKIAQAIADADGVTTPEIAVSAMVFGDGNGNPTTPDQNQVGLVRQVFSAELNRLELDLTASRYVAEAVIPASEGGWTVREVGLIDTDGDLFAVASFPDVYKPLASEGAIRDLVVRLVFEVTNAADVTLIVDPSLVLASRSWVEGNFNLSALLPGGTTGQVLRKRSNTDGDTEWFDPLLGLNILVDIVQEQQTLAAAQTVVTLAVATTSGLAVYVEGIRLHPGDYAINTATQITLTEAYPAGSKILLIQNEPAGGLTYLQSVLNLSDVTSKQAARANLGFPSATDPNFMGELWKSLMAFQYPVGELLMTRRVGNPSSWLGFGTWERYGSGRTIVSLDPLDASFNTLDQTGGTKTHVLSLGELPAHTHLVDPPQTATSSGGSHVHGVLSADGLVNSGEGSGTTISGKGIGYVGTGNRPQVLTTEAGAHTHVVDIPSFSSASSGEGQGHNNLQPYIVINIWKRTA